PHALAAWLLPRRRGPDGLLGAGRRHESGAKHDECREGGCEEGERGLGAKGGEGGHEADCPAAQGGCPMTRWRRRSGRGSAGGGGGGWPGGARGVASDAMAAPVGSGQRGGGFRGARGVTGRRG